MIKLKKGLFEGEGKLTQGFGENPASYARFGLKGHNGIDYGIPTGRKLYACIEGKVVEAQLDATGYGNYVKIENDSCGVIYGHLKSFNVKVGDVVAPGQVLGLSDNTGNSTGPHLHFGVFPKPRDRSNGYAGYIDPFDKTKVAWVDSFECEGCQKLEEELSEMRESRNKCKLKYEEADEAHTKEIREKIAHIEELQKTVAEQNTQLTLANGAYDAYAKDIEILRGEVEDGKRMYTSLQALLDEATAENGRLADRLRKCQKGYVSFIDRLKILLKGGE